MPGKAFEVPALTGPVVDQAQFLKPRFSESLALDLMNYKKQTGVQIQVLIISSLNDEAIESVAIKVFDQWKLGEAKTDQGVLFLVAAKEKRMRIEVGQGLEGLVPDVVAKRIISDVVRPYFREKYYEEGVRYGVLALTEAINKGKESGEVKTPQKKMKLEGGWVFLLLLGLWLLIFMISPATALQILFAALSGGRGGGSSNDRWSGGGGRSSGGGASGDW